MTIDDIANYCEFKECEVSAGSPEVGFIRIDDDGLSKNNNYQRFLLLNELGSMPSPGEVLDGATVFKVKDARGEKRLSREEFQAEYEKFLSLIEG